MSHLPAIYCIKHKSHKAISAMNQDNLKQVMRLTHQWIQDTNYKKQAEDMKHEEWNKILTDLHRWKPQWHWTYEASYLFASDTCSLPHLGDHHNDMCQTTYFFTYLDACSTRSDISLADYGK
jgi:hypothetical protein